MKFSLILSAATAVLALPTQPASQEFHRSVNQVWGIVDKYAIQNLHSKRDEESQSLDDSIKNRYLVTFKANATQQDISHHFVELDQWLGSDSHSKRDFAQLIEGAFSSTGKSALALASFAASNTSPFDGYYGKFNATIVEKLREDPVVEDVESDSIQTSPTYTGHELDQAYLDTKREKTEDALNSSYFHSAEAAKAKAATNGFATVVLNKQFTKSWGLARISHIDNDIPAGAGGNFSEIPDMEYIYSAPKYDTVAYVLDTGVNVTNSGFQGRASEPVKFVEGEPHGDYSGHGTHVAGIVGSSAFGVQKNAKIVSVKVLNMGNAGPTSSVINGVNWVIQNNNASRAVINYSAVGPVSKAMNQAFTKAVEAGIPVVVSAGNFMKDACNYSPANLGSVIDGAIVVAASDQHDKFAVGDKWGSNYGRCVNVFAPGTDIPSLHFRDENLVFFDSGTSMSAPFVSGLVLYHQSLTDTPLSPKDVADKIINSNPSKIQSPMADTSNGLAYNEALGPAPPIPSSTGGGFAPQPGQPYNPPQ